MPDKNIKTIQDKELESLCSYTLQGLLSLLKAMLSQ